METNPELALVSLATVGSLRDVESLLSKPIDDLAVDLAFRRAAAKGHSEIVARLLGHGASMREDDDEALRGAAVLGHTAVVSQLLARYKNAELLTIRSDTKEANLLQAVNSELRKRQMFALREWNRSVREMEI